jgi:hypothetical protein
LNLKPGSLAQRRRNSASGRKDRVRRRLVDSSSSLPGGGLGLASMRVTFVLLIRVGNGVATISQEGAVGQLMICIATVMVEQALKAMEESMLLVFGVPCITHPVVETFV